MSFRKRKPPAQQDQGKIQERHGSLLAGEQTSPSLRLQALWDPLSPKQSQASSLPSASPLGYTSCFSSPGVSDFLSLSPYSNHLAWLAVSCCTSTLHSFIRAVLLPRTPSSTYSTFSTELHSAHPSRHSMKDTSSRKPFPILSLAHLSPVPASLPTCSPPRIP